MEHVFSIVSGYLCHTCQLRQMMGKNPPHTLILSLSLSPWWADGECGPDALPAASLSCSLTAALPLWLRLMQCAKVSTWLKLWALFQSQHFLAIWVSLVVAHKKRQRERERERRKKRKTDRENPRADQTIPLRRYLFRKAGVKKKRICLWWALRWLCALRWKVNDNCPSSP